MRRVSYAFHIFSVFQKTISKDQGSLTHCLVIRPPKRAVRSRLGLVDIETLVGPGKRDLRDGGVIGKVSERFNLTDREPAIDVLGVVRLVIILLKPKQRALKSCAVEREVTEGGY